MKEPGPANRAPPPGLKERWGLLPFHIGDTAHHMALTDLLVRTVADRGPAAWWHATNVSTLLVGPSMRRLWGQDAPDGIAVATRHTGGGAVLVGPGVLGLDIALPACHPFLTADIVNDYRWLGLVWQDALYRLGISASVLSIEDARSMTRNVSAVPDAQLSCFASFSPYEVISGGKKVVGLSQVRRAGGVLFASAVHLDADPADLANALPLSEGRRRRLAAHLDQRATNLVRVAPHPPTPSDVMRAFRESLLAIHAVSFSASARWRKTDLDQAWEAAAADRRALT
jgi:lipoate-protein ligase A